MKRKKRFSAKLSNFIDFLVSETETSTFEGLELSLEDRIKGKCSTRAQYSSGLA